MKPHRKPHDVSDDTINQLFDIIEQRKNADAKDSYVASLHAEGTAKIAQKVGEEAVETCIEALQNNKEKLAEELADLLFHLMVLWSNQGLKPNDITSVLEGRMGIGGHEEKANRSQ